jgi:hypothetical protein
VKNKHNKNKVKKLTEALVVDPTQNFDSVNSMVEYSLKMFDSITTDYSVASFQEKELMQKAIEELSEKVEKKLAGLCEEMGITKEDLVEMSKDQKNYKQEDWNAIQGFRKELEDRKVIEASNSTPQKEKSLKKKKRKKKWLSA